MLLNNNLIINPQSLIKRMLVGALIGLAIISLFVFPVGEPNPSWGKYWIVRPLIITPLSGAMGILSFYFADFMGFQKTWQRIMATVLSLFVFVVALWVGIVLGLDGTLWD